MFFRLSLNAAVTTPCNKNTRYRITTLNESKVVYHVRGPDLGDELHRLRDLELLEPALHRVLLDLGQHELFKCQVRAQLLNVVKLKTI